MNCKVWIFLYKSISRTSKMRIQNYTSFCQVIIQLFLKNSCSLFCNNYKEANIRSSKFSSLIIPTLLGRMTSCVITLGKLYRDSQICLNSKLVFVMKISRCGIISVWKLPLKIIFLEKVNKNTISIKWLILLFVYDNLEIKMNRVLFLLTIYYKNIHYF